MTIKPLNNGDLMCSDFQCYGNVPVQRLKELFAELLKRKYNTEHFGLYAHNPGPDGWHEEILEVIDIKDIEKLFGGLLR